MLDGLVVEPEEGVQRTALLQLSHGMSEYKERYLPFMEFMAEHGVVCVIHDHRGHGKSVKSEQDLGFMYGAGGAGLVEDLFQVTVWAKKEYPDLPFILMGHSMGSLVVRTYAKEHDRELDALIVCGSPSKNYLRPLGAAVGHAEAAVLGDEIVVKSAREGMSHLVSLCNANGDVFANVELKERTQPQKYPAAGGRKT